MGLMTSFGFFVLFLEFTHNFSFFHLISSYLFIYSTQQ